jgi:hypothetical protein
VRVLNGRILDLLILEVSVWFVKEFEVEFMQASGGWLDSFMKINLI